MTYAQLASDVQDWCARTDIADKLPRMVSIFEGRINRSLRIRQMEADFSGTIASNVIAQPTDFLEVKRVWADDYPERNLQPQTIERVRGQTVGTPFLYAIDGTDIRFNGTGAVTGIYYKAIPNLYTNSYNWLSVLSYDAYLFGVLAEVATYQRDQEALAMHFARSTAIIDSLRTADRRLGGPLMVRAA
jgi:hypothetical protein